MDQKLSEIELRANVLASPAYQERCQVLYELFQYTRQWDDNPQSLLAIQATCAELLKEWQAKKKEFKRSKNQIGVAVVNRLILILKRIVDSLVWRVFKFDRVILQLLSEHPQTGHIDDTVIGDFTIAKQIIDDSGAFVFVNDLTTTLLHGDITIVQPDNNVSILENKAGNGSKKSGRSSRQRQRLEDMINFLNSKTRVSKDSTHDYILRTAIPLQTYHAQIAPIINQSKNKGYAQKIITDCFAVEAWWLNHPEENNSQTPPFASVKYAMSQTNFDVFDRGARRIVPYGVYPFADDICFALISGDLMLKSTLNFEALQKLYQQSGLNLEWSDVTDEEANAYVILPIGKRMQTIKKDRTVWFTLKHGQDTMRISPDMWGRILLEFLHEETMVQTHIDILKQVAQITIPEGVTTRMYYGYANETEVWI